MRRAWMLVSLLAAATVRAQEPAPEAFRVRRATLDLSIDYAAQRLSGSMTYDLENWTSHPARTVSFLLNRLMEASAVHDGRGGSLPYVQDVRRLHDDPMRQVTWMHVTLPRPVAAGAQTTVRIEYAGNLVGYVETGSLYIRDRIDSAFTIIREDALAFPVLGGLSDAANRQRPRGEFAYDASIRVPAGFLVASGGALTRNTHDDGTITWRYTSGGESPFLNVSIAPFDTISAGGVRLFYLREDSTGARRIMANSQSALRLLTAWFGPLRGSLNVTIAEIPNGWGSQASLVGGIIQAAAVFRDAGRAGELYHELSHLWNVRDTDTPSPRWNEGLASFLQDVLREKIDGWNGRQGSEARSLAYVQKQAVSDSLLRTVPMAAYGTKRATDYSYWMGHIMFATLYELVGEAQFNRVIGGFYQKYADGGSTREFVEFAKATSTVNLDLFFDDWIATPRWVTVVGAAASIADIANHYRH